MMPHPSVTTWTCTLLAALLVHTPGLACQFQFESSLSTKLLYLIGGVCEGAVFPFLVTRILLSGIISRFGSRSTRLLPVLLTTVVLLIVIALFVTVSVGDRTWQDASGGTTPDMWELVAGFKGFTL
jgi:hypothetical protein